MILLIADSQEGAIINQECLVEEEVEVMAKDSIKDNLLEAEEGMDNKDRTLDSLRHAGHAIKLVTFR